MCTVCYFPEKYAQMSLEEKRKEYRCGPKFVTLKTIATWPEYALQKKKGTSCYPDSKCNFEVNDKLNRKISLFQGDITCLEIDAIVNAANESLMGGGGVDGAIHSAAGKYLKNECLTLGGCKTGDAKITSGYKLPAKHVIHTVGPIGEHPELLKSCYRTCLELVKKYSLKIVAFPCISTGIYGYPVVNASHVALKTIREWLEIESNAENIERIILCVFLSKDLEVYENLLPLYFPLESRGHDENNGAYKIEEPGSAPVDMHAAPAPPKINADPQKAHDAPQKANDAPQKDQDAPQRAYDAPQKVQDAPQRAQDAPQKAHDAPQKAHDAPQKAHDAPQKAHDAPQKTHDAPQKTHNAPQRAYDAPQKAHDTPQRAHDAPQRAHDAPQKAHDAPQRVHDSPQRAHDSPQRAHDSPQRAHDSPQRAQRAHDSPQRAQRAHDKPPSQTSSPKSAQKLLKKDTSPMKETARSLQSHQIPVSESGGIDYASYLRKFFSVATSPVGVLFLAAFSAIGSVIAVNFFLSTTEWLGYSNLRPQ